MSPADAAVSTALSVALTIAVGLALALATNHLPRVPEATILAALSIAFNVGGAWKSRLSLTLPSDSPRVVRQPWPTRWVVPTVMLCSALVAFLGYLSWRLYLTPPPSNAYTVLSVSDHKNGAVVVVTNHQTEAMNFRIIVTESQRTIVNSAFALTAGGHHEFALSSVSMKKRAPRCTVRLMTEPGNKLYRSLVFN
jgi:hypothetical protein